MTTSTLSASAVLAHLPPPFSSSPDALTLIAQGAESLLFRTTFLDPRTPAALKVRPVKKWRHAILDKRLTRARVLAEARVLVRARREGVPVPAILGMDWEAGWLCMEWIEGSMVKDVLRGWDRKMVERQKARSEDKGGGEGKDETKEEEMEEKELFGLLARVGAVVGQLHLAGMVHGDLTTSNLMARPSSPRRPSPDSSALSSDEGPARSAARDEHEHEDMVLIDFGLAQQSISDEDRAVDLYVLERAFGSTHPRQERFFEHVLNAYGEKMGKAGKVVLRRLEDVRMRGRKKSMIG